jgi:D-alanine--poly(phosphoribitol) ligase subunit 1
MSPVDVLESIMEQAKSGPQLPAIADLDRSLSYGELSLEVARVAACLRDAGVGEGDRVALLVPNSVNFVVAALATLWLGAAFVPLAVSDPDARLLSIANDCAPALIVATRESDGTLAHAAVLSHFPHVVLEEIELHQAAEIAARDDSRIAYAIYTSGTTGTPKGVMIGRAAFGAAVRATAEALGLSRSTRTLCVSPFHFDGSFGTLFPTLFVGGAVIIRPRDALLFPRTFFKAIKDERITYTGFSPSYLRLLLTSPQMAQLSDSDLEVIALGGEASSASDVRALYQFGPSLRVFNRYGPTEATIAVTHVHLTPELVNAGVVPIGVPHPNVSFHLVGDEGQIIEGPDQMGELYIGGAQLMTGYWGAAELTNDVLRTDVVPGTTLYRTGDLVSRDGEGNYHYVGRLDDVVKRSGVRLSLVEMSEAVRRVEHVVAAACLTFSNEGSLGIAAFVVTDEPMTSFDLQSATRERLPDSMLPDKFVVVDDLPVTKSGKLDERALLHDAGLDTLRPTS